MKKEQTESPSAFDDAFNGLGFSNPELAEETSNLDDVFQDAGVTKIKDDQVAPDDVESTEEEKTEEPKDEHEDDSEIPEDVLNGKQEQKTEPTEEVSEEETDTISDGEIVDPSETKGVQAFFDVFADSLGLDVDEENKPDSIEGFANYIKDLVEENSKPTYANDQIQQLDEYVKNGGNFTDFYNSMSQTMSYDNIDIEDESNQKQIIKDYLKTSGYTDDQITKKIERYEDADMLLDEASDAQERLKEIKSRELETQQVYQEQLRRQQEEQTRSFYESVTSTVNSMTNVRGIQIPQSDRKALLDYIFKTNAEGKTQYELDYVSDPAKNLIESAYFTMKGNALLSEAAKNGESSATKKLRSMLRHSSKNHSTYNVNEEKQSQIWDIASKYQG